MASPLDAGPMSSAGTTSVGTSMACARAMISALATTMASRCSLVPLGATSSVYRAKYSQPRRLRHHPERHGVAVGHRANGRDFGPLHRQGERARLVGNVLRQAEDAEALQLGLVGAAGGARDGDVIAQMCPHRVRGAGEVSVQPVERVIPDAATDNLKMQVRALHVAGCATVADELPLLDVLAPAHADLGQVAVPCLQRVVVVIGVADAQHVAVALHAG